MQYVNLLVKADPLSDSFHSTNFYSHGDKQIWANMAAIVDARSKKDIGKMVLYAKLRHILHFQFPTATVQVINCYFLEM